MANLSILSDNQSSKSALGFWIYLMTDCLLFASLFATFIVLRGKSDYSELFSLPFVFAETIILLSSSFMAGLSLYYYDLKKPNLYWPLLLTTMLFGLIFITMEIVEFTILAHDGHSWTSNGFMTAYYTLVGTHGLHIFIGLIWLGSILIYLYKKGYNKLLGKKLFLWGMFWHFLDIVWIFIFTIVYLMGAIK